MMSKNGRILNPIEVGIPEKWRKYIFLPLSNAVTHRLRKWETPAKVEKVTLLVPGQVHLDFPPQVCFVVTTSTFAKMQLI